LVKPARRDPLSRQTGAVGRLGRIGLFLFKSRPKIFFKADYEISLIRDGAENITKNVIFSICEPLLKPEKLFQFEDRFQPVSRANSGVSTPPGTSRGGQNARHELPSRRGKRSKLA
jgi:hypothetical protein